MCLKESSFPDCWKVLSVDPVFKNVGERSTAKSDRLVNLLSRNINYDFRSQTDFKLRPIYTTAYGLRSLKYFSPKIWNIASIDIRNSNSLSEFGTQVKSWNPVACPCNLCRTFVYQVGYID